MTNTTAPLTFRRNIECPTCGSVLVGDWELVTCQKCSHTEVPTEAGHLLREDEIVRFATAGDILVAFATEG